MVGGHPPPHPATICPWFFLHTLQLTQGWGSPAAVPAPASPAWLRVREATNPAGWVQLPEDDTAWDVASAWLCRWWVSARWLGAQE